MIAEILQKGKENSLSSAEIMQRLGISDKRRFFQIIRDERIEGNLILSCSTGGFYLPANLEEVENFIKYTESRAKSNFFVLKNARKAVREGCINAEEKIS